MNRAAEIRLRGQPFRFLFLAAAFAIAAVYHFAALSIPAFAEVAYAPTYPFFRHIAFIAINLVFARLLLSRPRWFLLLYLMLTIQVINGHGVHAWQTWAQQKRIDWVDFTTVMLTLLGLAFLCADRRARRTGAVVSAA